MNSIITIDLIDGADHAQMVTANNPTGGPHDADTAPRLSHVGLYVHDVPKMIDFYTNVLGFVVSDGAEDGRITFLSRNPSDHHQVVLVRGRTTDAEVPMVQQVSFNVGTLAQVQKAFRKVRDAGCEGISPICHGNAWSVYFQDPEGNHIEMFCDTPWYVPQPWASRSTSTRPRTSCSARPKPIAGTGRGSSRWRNGAPKSARRSRQSSKPMTCIGFGTLARR